MVNVSSYDAMEFCHWLSRKDGQSYRLPTEAEWEYCCRAGTETLYWIGDDPEGLARIENVADASLKAKIGGQFPYNKGDDGHVFTAPVGRFAPNAWGPHDMHCNICEWRLDTFAVGYYQASPVYDPPGPSSRYWNPPRVIRGGSWRNIGEFCRSAYRSSIWPDSWSSNLGFRVARVPSETR